VTGDSLLGTVLAERYRLDALLGEGGMGKVYAAQHVLMRKRLAVKVLHRQLTQVPEVVQRFEREALAAAHIDHPNVAAATDFGKLADGSVYLVLEFVEGRSLRDEIAEGPLPPRRALHIARQIASALQAAHQLSIVHRDLKPENVMLVEKAGDRDCVKVLDFGIAKVPIAAEGDGAGEKPITKAGMIYGTPEYMAPEQALGQPVDGRADLYGLGVILYEMLSGVRPFTGKSQVGILGQQLTQAPPSFAQRAPGTDIPPAVEAFVLGLLAREADDRCPSATQALATLELLLGAPQEERLFTQFGGSPAGVVAEGSSFALRPEELSALGGDSSRAYGSGEARGALGSHPGVVVSAGTGGGERGDPVLRPVPPPGPLPGAPGAVGAPGPAAAPPLAPATGGGGRITSELRRVARYLETSGDAVPKKLRALVGHRSGGVLLGLSGLGAVALLGAIALVVLFASSTPTGSGAEQGAASAPEPGIDVLEERLAAAEEQGLAAVEELAKAEPTEGRVFVALASHRAKGGDFEGALDAVSKALALDPKLFDHPRIAGVLFRAAQASESSAAAFRLLQGPMGTRGADILYDLAHTPGVRDAVRRRASQIVVGDAFADSASPALSVALDLRRARGCAAYRALLERAKNVGDGRALELLRPLQSTTGCGAQKQADCYPCLRGDSALDVAIETIQKRIAPPADHAATR